MDGVQSLTIKLPQSSFLRSWKQGWSAPCSSRTAQRGPSFYTTAWPTAGSSYQSALQAIDHVFSPRVPSPNLATLTTRRPPPGPALQVGASELFRTLDSDSELRKPQALSTRLRQLVPHTLPAKAGPLLYRASGTVPCELLLALKVPILGVQDFCHI